MASDMSLVGVEIFLNASGSYHQLNKLTRKTKMITEATLKTNGIYLYSNLRGCDGGSFLFDGASIIA